MAKCNKQPGEDVSRKTSTSRLSRTTNPSAIAELLWVGVFLQLSTCNLRWLIYTTKGELSPKAVLTNLSSKLDEFLAERSQFDSDHRVNFYAPTCCLSATFVPLLFAFVLCFLRQKIINNVAFRHILRCLRCSFRVRCRHRSTAD